MPESPRFCEFVRLLYSKALFGPFVFTNYGPPNRFYVIAPEVGFVEAFQAILREWELFPVSYLAAILLEEALVGSLGLLLDELARAVRFGLPLKF